jgi:3-isopropylmalate/(R)-2-methylmalate dehydratase small subunit
VVALAQKGIRVVVAPSFGDIFYSNCFQNGVLPVRLPEAQVKRLMGLSRPDGPAFTVDLMRQLVIDAAGETHSFDIDPLRREGLLAGLDDVGLTLRDEALIQAWQTRDRNDRPWAWEPIDRPTARESGEAA